MRIAGLLGPVPALAGLALVASLLAGGCGTTESLPLRSARESDLATMVLPKGDLGRFGEGLAVDADSGPENNREAAENSLDPRDTARTLRQAGRLAGYELSYSDPAGSGYALSTKKGVIVIGTGVEL